MQDQYLAKSLSNRLQELALSLRELGGLLEDGLQYDEAIEAIKRCKLWIEWTAIEVGIDGAAELVDLQVKLARSQLNLSRFWGISAQRQAVARQVILDAERVAAIALALGEPQHLVG